MFKILIFVFILTFNATVLRADELAAAIKSNNIGDVKLLVRKQDLTTTSTLFGTPLILAVRLERFEIVKQLVAAGADVNQVVVEHNCALSEAVRQRNVRMARLLLDLGADPNRRFTKKEGNRETVWPSPVDEACKTGNPEMLDLLLNSGGDPNSRRTVTALAWVPRAPVATEAERKDLRRVIRRLLEADVDPNHGYSWASSPLVVAISLRRTEALRILLEECPTIDTNRRSSNRLPLRRAIIVNPAEATGSVEESSAEQTQTTISLVKLLLQHGAKVTPDVLHHAATPEIRQLLENALVQSSPHGTNGQSRLQEAAENNLKDLMEADIARRLSGEIQQNADLAALVSGTTSFRAETISTFNNRCAKCHGAEGRGRTGKLRVFPFAARYLSWKSTKIGVPPTRDDLARVIRNGLPRSKMPASPDLSEDQVLQLADYVSYLAVINETSRILRVAADKESETTRKGELSYVSSKWKESADPKGSCGKVVGTSTPESIRRGEVLFNGGRARCSECHGLSGKGDGEINSWLPRGQKEPGFAATPGLTDLLDRHLVVPGIRNLRLNQSSRQDVYNTIAAGIPNINMPGMHSKLNPQEISDLADFVLRIADTSKDLMPDKK